MVSTWVGNNDGKSMSGLVSGVTGAAPIWRLIVDRMMEIGYEALAFETPADVIEADLDIISGYPAHDDFPSRTVKIVRGTAPTGEDPIHVLAKICHGEEKLATSANIAGGSYETKEYINLREDDPISQDGRNRYQEAIDAWVGDNSKYKLPTEYCGSRNDIFVTVVDLEDQKTYSESKLKFRVRAETGEGIEKVELWINGEKKAEGKGNEMEREFDLGSGQYLVWARAVSKSGKTQDSSHYRIGTGGADWKQSEAKPSPSPSPTPEGGDED